MPLAVWADVIAMPNDAPLSTSVTLSTWPEGEAKSTSDESSGPTAPDGAPTSSLMAVSAGLFEGDHAAQVPPVRQALVRANPANGRKAFYVASHACEIVGMPTAEGRSLIRELIAAATQPDAVYTHRWRAGDLVMWDNRCMLHRGRPWDESKYRRVMHRTTVAGDGPTAPEDEAAVAIGPAREADFRWARAQLAMG